jgi:hypothetical protein
MFDVEANAASCVAIKTDDVGSSTANDALPANRIDVEVRLLPGSLDAVTGDKEIESKLSNSILDFKYPSNVNSSCATFNIGSSDRSNKLNSSNFNELVMFATDETGAVTVGEVLVTTTGAAEGADDGASVIFNAVGLADEATVGASEMGAAVTGALVVGKIVGDAVSGGGVYTTGANVAGLGVVGAVNDGAIAVGEFV